MTRKRLQELWESHPDAERPLKAWLAMARLKPSSGPHEVRQDCAAASVLGKWRTVFKRGGNTDRLVVDRRDDVGRIDIRQVLTHEEDSRRTPDGSLSRAAKPRDAEGGQHTMAELLAFTTPHVLRNEAEYPAAVAEIARLLDTDPPPHSEAYERLECLSVLVQAYDEAHFPREQLTTPQDVVAFMLEQKGLSHDDLAQGLGGASPMLAFLEGPAVCHSRKSRGFENSWVSRRIS
jgi:antitoxin component HigA of HigAB toxin-antitoxin module/mRNA-degrading endonuclease HigB of HigAB toxin-antitoxin module